MYVSRYYSEKKIDYINLFILISIPISVIHIYLSYKMSLDYVWYKLSNIGQLLYVSLAIIILYNICTKINNKKVEYFVNIINPHTFNIFLYHVLIINIMQFAIYPHFNLSIKYQFLISTFIIFTSVITYCYIANIFNTKKNGQNH